MGKKKERAISISLRLRPRTFRALNLEAERLSKLSGKDIGYQTVLNDYLEKTVSQLIELGLINVDDLEEDKKE